MSERTNDGDTKAAIERVQAALTDWEAAHAHGDHGELCTEPLDALDLITTTLSEQEAELERYRAKFKLLEDGLRRAMTCQHHDVAEECAHGRFGFDCARKDCHQVHAENFLAALHSGPPEEVLAAALTEDSPEEGRCPTCGNKADAPLCRSCFAGGFAHIGGILVHDYCTDPFH